MTTPRYKPHWRQRDGSESVSQPFPEGTTFEEALALTLQKTRPDCPRTELHETVFREGGRLRFWAVLRRWRWEEGQWREHSELPRLVAQAKRYRELADALDRDIQRAEVVVKQLRGLGLPPAVAEPLEYDIGDPVRWRWTRFMGDSDRLEVELVLRGKALEWSIYSVAYRWTQTHPCRRRRGTADATSADPIPAEVVPYLLAATYLGPWPADVGS